MNTIKICSKKGFSSAVLILLVIFIIIVSFLVIYFIFFQKVESGFGSVEGFVYSPKSVDALSDVKVYVLEDSSITNFTDESGYFYINQIPSGKQRIVFEQGSFKNEFTIDIAPNTLLSLKGDNAIKLGSGEGASI
ncbi:carboxypeptidase-like regulatory domain-containing protein, partial [Candidatus Pacearchaeota archaeon]|nr:carboxypeptidase-like regulatory domain-containing protein [Candidatus Pacearchaeota archaeon]